jgi:hypothetical protein
MMLLPR